MIDRGSPVPCASEKIPVKKRFRDYERQEEL
jgi:hypothetical protein